LWFEEYISEWILILLKGFSWTGFTGFSRLLSRFPEETVKKGQKDPVNPV
jgi:hypothetical protein